MGIISIYQWRQLFPKAPLDFIDVFNSNFEKYGIVTLNRVSGFLSQTCVESGGFVTYHENLNYSSSGLLETFPTYFTPDTASICARNPELIANYAYANRLGNGPPQTGDGWNFRGRGIIQVTGRANYQEFADWKNLSLEATMQYLETFDGFVESAFWFWDTRKCNLICGDISKLSTKVNGKNPANGLQERIEVYDAARLVFSGGNYTGSGFGGNWHKDTGDYVSLKNAPGDEIAALVARDSDNTQGSHTKSDKPIRLTNNFYRDQFACKDNCGADTVDIKLGVFLQVLSNKLENRPFNIILGTICWNYKGEVKCDQRMQHILGKAADIQVPAWAARGFPAMTSIEIIKLIENVFKDVIYCYAIDSTTVHCDVGNW